MSFVQCLACKECDASYPEAAHMMCERCFGPLEVRYDYAGLRKAVDRRSIEAGPRSLWRYRELLPVEGEPAAGLRSGFTPLVRAERLARELGVRELYVKDDSANLPTFSYKDRVVAVAVTRARELGFDTVACASTGNLAHAVAAHAACAGLHAVVLIPHDLEQAKVTSSLVFGAQMVKVRGSYDDVNRLCTQVADLSGWAIVNVNLRPYYTEGAKTHGFEIAEQLGWRLPHHTVVPVAGGTILPKVWKAYRELVTLGLVEDTGAQLHAAQAEGCDPVVRAIVAGEDAFRPQKPATIAKSIAIGNPADGYYAIRAVRESGGFAASASDRQILEAVELLARTEGIFTEPAGGTTLAAAMALIASGRIPRDESICVSITGNGLKTIEAQAGRLPDVPVIDARFDAIAGIVGSLCDRMREDARPAASASQASPSLGR
jgi:threonine synthase